MQSCWLRLSSKSNGPRPKSSGRTLSAGQQISPASSALALHRASCLRPDPRGPCRPQIRSNSRLQNPRTARRAPTPTMYAGKPRLARMGSSPATTKGSLHCVFGGIELVENLGFHHLDHLRPVLADRFEQCLPLAIDLGELGELRGGIRDGGFALCDPEGRRAILPPAGGNNVEHVLVWLE